MIRLFRVFIPVGVLTVLLTEILLITAVYVVASYYVLEVDPTNYLLYDNGLVNIGIVLFSITIGLYLQDLYSNIYVKSTITLMQQLCLAIGAVFLIQGFISYLDATLRMPLHIMMIGSILAILSIFCWRIVFGSFMLQMVGRDRLLFVGNSSLLDDIAQYLDNHPETGLEVIGFVVDPGDLPQPNTSQVLGSMCSLQEIVTETNPARVIVGMFERRNRLPVADLLELRFAGRIIEEAASAYERVCGRVPIKELRPSQLIYSGELGPRRQTMLVQTLSNLFVAGFGIILSSPIMLLSALAVRLSSAGSGSLPPAARRFGWHPIHDLQIPVHARGFRSRHGSGLGHQGRPPRHQSGKDPSQITLRRTAAALQRSQRRDVAGRPASRAARVRQEPDANRFLTTASGTAFVPGLPDGHRSITSMAIPWKTPSSSWSMTCTTSRTSPSASISTSSCTP